MNKHVGDIEWCLGMRLPIIQMKGLLCLLACTVPCIAISHSATGEPAAKQQNFSDMEVVDIGNGLNRIDIDGDGKPDLIVQGARLTIGAHNYENTSFYIRDSDTAQDSDGSDQSKDPLLLIVPFIGGEHASPFEKDSFSTAEGADCILGDIIILRSHKKNSSLIVVQAERDFGKSYIDRQHVTFSIYKLKRDPDSGSAVFERTDRFLSKHVYCDADYAAQEELGIRFVPALTDGD